MTALVICDDGADFLTWRQTNVERLKMSNRRAPLAPRLTAFVGMVLIFLSVALKLGETNTAILQVAGGLLGIGGILWLIVAMRRT